MNGADSQVPALLNNGPGNAAARSLAQSAKAAPREIIVLPENSLERRFTQTRQCECLPSRQKPSKRAYACIAELTRKMNDEQLAISHANKVRKVRGWRQSVTLGGSPASAVDSWPCTFSAKLHTAATAPAQTAPYNYWSDHLRGINHGMRVIMVHGQGVSRKLCFSRT